MRRAALGPFAFAAASIALVIPAAWHVRTFVSVLRARLAYPFSIEWLEDGALYEAYRILHHLPLYVAPSRHFFPYPYPPFQFIVVALSGWLFGLDYSTGRAVSIAGLLVASIVSAGVVARHAPVQVAREHLRSHVLEARGGRLAAALSVAVSVSLAASYDLLDGVLDTARGDSLGIALVIVAAALVDERREMSWRRCAAVALPLVLATFTKQTEIFFVVWVLLFVTARDRRSGLRLAALSLGLALAALIPLLVATDGWFWFWVMNTRRHALHAEGLRQAWPLFLRHQPFVALFPVALVWLRRRRALSASAALWTGLVIAALPASLLPLAKQGGWVNDLLPLAALAWPAAALLALDAGRATRGRSGWSATLSTTVLLGAAWLLARLEYDPTRHVPTAEEVGGAEALHALVRSLEGGVIVPMHSFLAPRNGDPTPQIALIAYLDAAAANMEAPAGADVDASGARWLITSGFGDMEQGIETDAFRFVRDLDVGGDVILPRGARKKRLFHRVGR